MLLSIINGEPNDVRAIVQCHYWYSVMSLHIVVAITIITANRHYYRGNGEGVAERFPTRASEGRKHDARELRAGGAFCRSVLSLVRGVGAVAGYRQYRLDAQPSTCFAGTPRLLLFSSRTFCRPVRTLLIVFILI